jgi:predicted glycosyltransferase
MRGLSGKLLAWIDIDYPPQVQYLLPFKRALEERGHQVAVTARDVGVSFELLQDLGVMFEPVGASFGVHRWRKAVGTLGRTRQLRGHARRDRTPDFVIATGRSATLAARLLRRPSFAVVDYEHVNFTIQRLAGPILFFPDVIEIDAFLERGLDSSRLIPFPGLKEDISFAFVELDEIPAHRFGGLPEGLTRVLVRPPTEESHYYRTASRELTLATLERLSAREDAVVILSPRHPWQVEDLRRWQWRVEPIVLEQAVPAVPLLKGVDVVIAAGGTMIREAAYLGVPAYSLFRGKIGQVDRYLERLGRIEILSERNDLERIQLAGRTPLQPFSRKPWLVDELLDRILERVVSSAVAPQTRPVGEAPGPGRAL